MIKLVKIENFNNFYNQYKEDVDKHIKEYLDTCGIDNNFELDIDLFQKAIDAGVSHQFKIFNNGFLGYISLATTPSTIFKDQVDCTVDHIYIKEEYRGKNYFSLVLDQIEDVLVNEGVNKIMIGLPDSTTFDKFAKQKSFTKMSSIYYKNLGD